MGARHGVRVHLALWSAALLGLGAPAGFARAAETMAMPDPASAKGMEMPDPAAAKGMEMADPAAAKGTAVPDHAAGGSVRSLRDYPIPAVRLVRDDGKAVSLPDEMNDGRPIVLNFIFTTCSDICPLMSSVFAQFERRLGADADQVHLMSISIDPEQDTPARLREYARRFHAGPTWRHYTGTLEASIAAQKAFGVYRGGKMSHAPVTLIRAAPGEPWLRIEGIVTPDELVRDYRGLLAEAPDRE